MLKVEGPFLERYRSSPLALDEQIVFVRADLMEEEEAVEPALNELAHEWFQLPPERIPFHRRPIRNESSYALSHVGLCSADLLAYHRW